YTMEYVDGIDFLSYVRGLDRSEIESQVERAAALSAAETADLSDLAAMESTIDGEESDLPSVAARACDEDRLRAASRQLVEAILAVHHAGKVHRDIKPANVLVTDDGHVVLLDFGLVTDGGVEESHSTVVGTALYMAPEQALKQGVTPAADWYSFGVMLYEALTGVTPHSGGGAIEIMMKKQQFEPPPPRSRLPSVARDLDALCTDLLRIDPEKRPRASEILERLGVDVRRSSKHIRITSSAGSDDGAPFVGRRSELDFLETAYARCLGGTSATVFVTGESGVGKSELMRRFARERKRADRELVVFSGRCYERETVPYKAWDGIVDQLVQFMFKLTASQMSSLLPLRAHLLPELFPTLNRVDVIAGAPREMRTIADPQERRTRMFEAFRELFLRLAQRRRVILVIDDFQWVDADSLTLLDQLMNPPDEPPLLLLVTSRLPEEGDVAELPGHDLLRGEVHHLRLGALSPESSRELVRRLSSRAQLDDGLSDTIASEAGGHPLFIRELALYVDASGAPAESLGKLDDALWARIELLDGLSRNLVEVLSVAGTPLRQHAAAIACDMSYADYERACGVLRIASFARTSGPRESDTVEVYHDRVREAVVAKLSAEKLRRLHYRIAIALERTEPGEHAAQALVRHFEAAGENERAAQQAAKAAAQANRASAFERAVEFYQLALKLGRYDDASLRALQFQLGEALANAGRGAEAAETFDRVANVADPAIRLECHRLSAEHLLISGHLDRGMAAVDSLLHEIGLELARTPRRSLMALLWYRFRLRLRGMRWPDKHESEIPRADLIKLDVHKAVAYGLALVDNIRGAEYNSRYLLLALQVGDVDRIGRALGTEIVFLASQGGRGARRAKELVGVLATIAERTKNPFHQLWLTLGRAVFDYFAGRFRATAEAGERVDRDYYALEGTRYEVNNSRLFRIFSLGHCGEWAECDRLANQFIRDAIRRGDRYVETTMRRYTSFLWLARDDVDGAKQNLERATWLPPEGKFHFQHWYELEARVELVLYTRRCPEGRAELAGLINGFKRSMLLRIQLVRSVFLWAEARLLLGSLRDPAVDRAATLRSVARNARRLAKEGVSYARLYAMLLNAALQLQRADSESARETLSSAASYAAEVEMNAIAAAARFRLGLLQRGAKGDEMVAEAMDFFRAQGVACPEKMVEVLTPGFAVAEAPGS
ncbi:MAG: AAA family ATPase, partial [Myxococcales bacterium]|nr:AAA family ATPase [Myxococcales bacterium]